MVIICLILFAHILRSFRILITKTYISAESKNIVRGNATMFQDKFCASTNLAKEMIHKILIQYE